MKNPKIGGTKRIQEGKLKNIFGKLKYEGPRTNMKSYIFGSELNAQWKNIKVISQGILKLARRQRIVAP